MFRIGPGTIWDKLLKSRSGFLYTRVILNQRDLQKHIRGHSQSVCLCKNLRHSSFPEGDVFPDNPKAFQQLSDFGFLEVQRLQMGADWKKIRKAAV